MAASAMLFALMNFCARLASASASWASVGAVRAVVGALVAVAVARVTGASLAATDRRAIFWRSVFGTGAMVSTFYALSSRTLALGDTVTLLNLTPVFLAVLAPLFLRERTTAGVAAAIAVSLAGVVLVVKPAFVFGAGAHVLPGSAGAGPSAHTTAAVAALAAALTSIAMMLLRRVGQSESAEAIALHFSLFAAGTLTLLSLFDPRLPSGRDFLLMVVAGLCAGLGQLAMTRAYTLERAARVSGMSYLAVVASAVLGAIALGEVPTVTALVGMVLVIGGGLLVTFTRDTRAGP
jgi:drug/metabolite transporter (DMT)-like permease